MLLFIRILGFLFLFRLLRKAKKMNKKIETQPETIDESEGFELAAKIIKVTLWIWGVKPIYYGLSKLTTKSTLIISNHQSNYDGLLVYNAYIKRFKTPKITFIGKKELKKWILVKHFFKLVNTIFIDRDDVRSAIASFKDAKNFINKFGHSIVIFPEGTRSKSYKMNNFKAGSFKIAYSSSCPIQPFFIINSFKLPKFPIFRKKVHVVIEDLIPSKKFLHMTTVEFSKIMEKKYNEFLKKYKDNI